MEYIFNLITKLGTSIMDNVQDAGKMGRFFFSLFKSVFRFAWRIRNVLKQIVFIGVKSSFVIILTGTFTGMVLGLQGFYSLNKFGATTLLGPTVAISLIRELGPVLTALMIAARAGSALTAEIGSMRVTEQLDALQVMGISPMNYLIAPNMVAGILTFPLLTAVFDTVGIWGAYIVGVYVLGISKGSYFGEMATYVEFSDVYHGILKSLTFATVVLWICLYKGYFASGGAKGVSKATTEAVVLSSVHIFVWDYIITAFLSI
jgi:phospholipid/cholesterol/gamma-HCH transport system permease protein